MTNPIDETSDINNIDIEEAERNAIEEIPADEEIPNEEKKSKASKKRNIALDARRRLEDIHDAKQLSDSLDYLYITEKEKDDVIL